MKKYLSTLAGLALAGVLGLAALPANAWWGGWDDDYYDHYGPWGGGPWYGGYPGYGYWWLPRLRLRWLSRLRLRWLSRLRLRWLSRLRLRWLSRLWPRWLSRLWLGLPAGRDASTTVGASASDRTSSRTSEVNGRVCPDHQQSGPDFRPAFCLSRQFSVGHCRRVVTERFCGIQGRGGKQRIIYRPGGLRWQAPAFIGIQGSLQTF